MAAVTNLQAALRNGKTLIRQFLYIIPVRHIAQTYHLPVISEKAKIYILNITRRKSFCNMNFKTYNKFTRKKQHLYMEFCERCAIIKI